MSPLGCGPKRGDGQITDMPEIKGPNLEQSGEDSVEKVIEKGVVSTEAKIERGADRETFKEKEKRALDLAKEIAGPDKKDDQGDVEVEPEDIEQKKEILVSRLVEAALAAGDNVDEAIEVMERAKKYLGKYPGLVDDIHDRWLEERNKGMY